MNILTATNGRPEIAEVWCAAVTATLTTPYVATVLYHGPPPRCSCAIREVSHISATIGMAVDQYASGPVRMYLEEDMIPVRPWSVDDYQGRVVAAQGNESGQPWPALTIHRDSGDPATHIVAQRYVRDGGCPEWLPEELCEPAMRANAKVLGEHFIHIDKMYRKDIAEAGAKNELLDLLRSRFALPSHQPASRGLGDMVATALASVGITKQLVQRVASSFGVKDCGCDKRQKALTAFGRSIGIGEPPHGKAKPD